jgi:hypothetical protein
MKIKITDSFSQRLLYNRHVGLAAQQRIQWHNAAPRRPVCPERERQGGFLLPSVPVRPPAGDSAVGTPVPDFLIKKLDYRDTGPTSQ